MTLAPSKYSRLLDSIGLTLQRARENAVKVVNMELVKANWLIGKYIVEYEQEGKGRAEYGTQLLTTLSQDLKIKLGKGFSRSNLQLMRQFYIKYPNLQATLHELEKRQTVSGKSGKRQTVSGKSQKHQAPASALLSWSHYAELLTISDDLARSFYEKQAVKENWSFREMKRQIEFQQLLKYLRC
jgi:hypothetical protein